MALDKVSKLMTSVTGYEKKLLLLEKDTDVQTSRSIHIYIAGINSDYVKIVG